MCYANLARNCMLRIAWIVALCWITNGFAAQPLSADQAFQFSATAKDYQTVLLIWKIAPGYYLYQKDFKIAAIKPANATLGEPLYPNDPKLLKTILGTFSVYSGTLTVPVPIIQSDQNSLILQVKYQGCSQSGYCYPPTTKNVVINLAENYGKPVYALNIDIAPTTPITIENPFEKLFQGHSQLWLIVGFLGIGILLSLTPCVLPMIPILSSMILGKTKMSHAQAFFISLSYVLGMSLTYALTGILFGIIGANISIFFQKPEIITIFSALFILMALSLFGLFQLQLPEKWRAAASALSQHQKRGTYVGAFLMGALSILIVSPCITPPLVATLSFISQTGDAVLGGAALFAMGVGMGAPLLFIGLMGPKILPKSGKWMNTVKNFMGILLLAVAIFMLQRILPEIIAMMLWIGLCIGVAIYLGAFSSAVSVSAWIKKIIGLLFFGASIFLAMHTYHNGAQPSSLSFQSVYSTEDVEKALKNAPTHQIIMLDFYADWCIACKELDNITFENNEVKNILSQYTLLRANITKNSAQDQILMQQYNVIAPPTILFFQNGQEISNSRVIGFQSATTLLQQLEQIEQNHPNKKQNIH